MDERRCKNILARISTTNEANKARVNNKIAKRKRASGKKSISYKSGLQKKKIEKMGVNAGRKWHTIKMRKKRREKNIYNRIGQ